MSLYVSDIVDNKIGDVFLMETYIYIDNSFVLNGLH